MSLSLVIGALLLAGACGYLGLAAYVWRHRTVAGARALTVLLLAIGWWTICYALELSSVTVGSAKLWAGVKYVGVVAIAPALWAFVLRYTSRSRALTRPVLALMLIEPLVVLVLLAVPATHDLVHYYPDDPALLRRVGAGGAPVSATGPLLWLHAGYTYLLLAGALGLLVVRLARIAATYRRAAVTMIAASLLPLLGNIVFAFDVARLGHVDLTPFLFSVTAVVLVVGFFRLRLLDLLPVARGVVVEQMADGVVVLDVYGRIADTNPAARGILGGRRADLVGVCLADLVPALAPVLDGGEGTSGPAEAVLRLPRGGGAAVDLAVTTTPITDGGRRVTAQVVVLRDISDLKRTERRLRELLAEQTRLADTLQQSLRPRTLPQVPGVRVAARSVPAGPGGRVSGDFYDLHPAADRRWAFVLGDVAGRGVHAAVVTSMARYTVRTLSAQGAGPVEVLTGLNAALLADDDEERFCTLVYGLLEVPRHGRGLDLTLTLGGHPPALLRRATTGCVSPVGRPGSALGMLDELEVEAVPVRLEPGDVLLAYTDGVTEARSGREEFGEERLGAVLAAAGTGVDDVADAVLAAVEAFCPDRDDVALLVIAPGE